MNQLKSADVPRWQKIVQGDTREFASFVDQYKNLVTSIAYSAIGDLAASEDIAQETFLVAWLSRNDLSDPEKQIHWLSSIARNLSKQWLRKRSAKSWASSDMDSRDVMQEAPHPSEQLVSDEEQQLVWGALEALPENYREVLVMYYRESHSIAEVALALEMTEETARQRLARGRSLLRAEVERTIEAALVNSRPSVHFTVGVMSLISAGSSSALAKVATTATAGLASKSAGTVLAATQSVATPALIGAAGGLLGAIGGLGGTWLGIRLPQLLAPTMTERRLLEREGKVVWRLALLHMVFTLATVVLALIFARRTDAVMWAVLGNMLMAVCFAVTCVIRGMRLNKQIKQLRQTLAPEEDPNPTWLKQRIGLANGTSQPRWAGRRMTSQRTWLGWPLYDFQVSDPNQTQYQTQPAHAQPLHARGWLAVGDKATGFLAIGGIARGFIALGGFSVGVISFGGFAIGLLALGGGALGVLALGGLAVGHSAIGGGAVGWQAAGGGAIGVYSANGGLAIAGHIAEGGLAISTEYAVGGDAKAPEANTEEAKSECRKSWVASYIDQEKIRRDPGAFRSQLMIFTTVIPVGFSVLIALVLPMLMYRRV